MKTLFGGSEGIRTITFPRTIKIVRQAAFCEIESLPKVVMNEGLETLGIDELTLNGNLYLGVFQGSGLRSVVFPSTLKRVEYCAFMGCENLKAVCLPEGLEYLGIGCFLGTGIENIEFPASLRIISQASFSWCKNLKSVKFAEGLEALGTDERRRDGSMWSGAFQESALESVILPSTLRRIAYRTFTRCRNLKAIELPDGLG